jgi:lipoprotein signal peptidase
VEKILKVGEGCSIVKTFFVMVGVRNSGIAFAIVVLFLLSLKTH